MNSSESSILKNFNKKNIFSIIYFSVLISFAFGYITPLDIVLNNQNSFAVGFWNIALQITVITLQMFVVFAAVLTIGLMINSLIFNVLKIFITCIALAAYIQEIFLNGKK